MKWRTTIFRSRPNSRGVAEKSTKEGLRQGVFHHLLEERERTAIYSAQLRGIVDRVLADVWSVDRASFGVVSCQDSSVTLDGGAVAAYGFRRQYLAAAEEILRILKDRIDDLTGLILVIEPTRAELGAGSEIDDDIVDFAIELDSNVVRLVQVKSSKAPSGMNPLRYSDAAQIFGRMKSSVGELVILTNKPLTKKLLQACGAPTRSPDAF